MSSSELTQKHQHALLVQRRAVDAFETALPSDRAKDKLALEKATRMVAMTAKDLSAAADRDRAGAPGPQRPPDPRRKLAPKPLSIPLAHGALLREVLKGGRHHAKLS